MYKGLVSRQHLRFTSKACHLAPVFGSPLTQPSHTETLDLQPQPPRTVNPEPELDPNLNLQANTDAPNQNPTVYTEVPQALEYLGLT